jgi:DNA-binding winged helix-turn-helix (wHTH) protein/tetratricopeptide (TPR) repeat protein
MTGKLYEFGEFRFLPSARELWRGTRRVDLPRHTFECLDLLIANRDRAVGRDELVQAIFRRSNVSDAQLGQVILRTRRAVQDDGNSQHAIRTIVGFGYRWVADTHERNDERAGEQEAPAPAGGPTTAEPPDPASAARDSRATRSRRRIGLSLAVALAAVAIGIALQQAWRSDPDPAPRTTPVVAPEADVAVILPLEVDGLREDSWVRLGAMDLVAERLREAGFTVPPSENVLGLLSARSETDPGVLLRRETGASLMVRGKAVRDAAGWRVELAAAPADGIAVPVSFSAREAVPAARGASDLLLAALGRSIPTGVEHDVALDETLQRARAALLANELDTARAILEGSRQLAAQPARLAYRLAQVDFRAGRLDAAEAALQRVLDLPETRADTKFHAEVLNALGATRMRRGEFARSGRDFDAALELLGTDGDALARGRARMGRANARVAAQRFDEALADFGAARVELESAGDGLGVTRVDANLGMLELYRGRPAAALGYLPGAADRFESFGALHELLLSLTGLVEAQLAMLEREQAWATVERGWALRERITDPDQRVDLLLNRAQVLLGFGRLREAGEALDRARTIATSGNRGLLARLRWLDAARDAELGQWREAEAATGLALAEWPGAGADGDRAAVVLIRQRALLALGRDAEARELLDRARPAPSVGGEQPGRVAEALAMAEWALHVQDEAAAAAWFGFATATAERRGVPAEIVAAVAAAAPRLLVAGKETRAAELIGRVASWAGRDFDCALLQLRLYHALGQREAWFDALRGAQALAGEREIPAELLAPRADAPAPRLRLGAARLRPSPALAAIPRGTTND